MLEGININLKVAEKEDIPLLAEWFNDVKFLGEFKDFPIQTSKVKLEKRILEQKDWVNFLVKTKNGKKIGWAAHYIATPNLAGWR